MVLNLIPWIIMALSAIGIVVIVLRKIPVLLKLPVRSEEIQPGPSFIEKIKIKIKGLKYSSYQPAITNWVEKVLRKLRVLILKIDNLFISLIGKARDRSQIWTVRSRAWMEQHQLKKIEKLKVLEKLDKAQVLETIQKAKEGAQEEQKNIEKSEKELEPEEISEEKNLIDLIARDPRDFEAYKKLGFFYLERGNKEDAKNCFRQVLKLNPEDMEVISKMRELG